VFRVAGISTNINGISLDNPIYRTDPTYRIGVDYCNVTGTVTCDSNSPYLVMLKMTGSNGSSFKEQYCCVYVVNGSGTFSTFDIGVFNLDKPNNTFEILGFMAANEK
jgi:hypothetical protein